MTQHPDRNALRAYAAGELAPRDAIAVDAHVAGCAGCRQALAEAPTRTSAARMLRRIERAGGHLAYEDLSALVDGKLARARLPGVEKHLAACPRCRRELAEMKSFAPSLARPLPGPAAAKGSWLESLRDWFAAAPTTRGIAAALVAGFAATLVLSARIGPSGPGDGASSTSSTSASVGSGGEGPVPDAPIARDAFDRNVFERLDRFAPDAVAPYRANDIATLARVLKARADKGDASAMQAYALLLAEGRGVKEDRAAAIRLLNGAAAAKDPGAAHNLDVLQRTAATGSYSR